MKHYVLIDNHSGYVWGETDAVDPIEACSLVDHEVGGYNRTYERERLTGSNKSGYHVYEAPQGWIEVHDGQDSAEIGRVETQCKKAAEVAFKTEEEQLES